MHQKKERNFLGSFLITYEDLLLIKALDGIANNPHKKKIIIAAGGLHIRDLEPFLEKMGFEKDIEDGKELNGVIKDNVDKTKATFNQNHVNYQERMLNAKTVEDMRNILGEEVSLLRDEFFGYVAFLWEKYKINPFFEIVVYLVKLIASDINIVGAIFCIILT